jgi:hypothetical protein
VWWPPGSCGSCGGAPIGGNDGRGPTPEEEAAADRTADAADGEVAEPYEDMLEKGAAQESEGNPASEGELPLTSGPAGATVGGEHPGSRSKAWPGRSGVRNAHREGGPTDA